MSRTKKALTSTAEESPDWLYVGAIVLDKRDSKCIRCRIEDQFESIDWHEPQINIGPGLTWVFYHDMNELKTCEDTMKEER